ncbi:MAG: glycoside hydrolase [Acidobacteriia bacterium]|nr:glycoside hydrolase [Terriglobia bacterium]
MKLLRSLFLSATLVLPAVSQTFSATPLANPAGPGSLEPNLSATPDGAVVLSWIEPSKDGSSALRYAVRRGSTWSQPQTIAANRHFFRHPAEVPEVMTTAAGHWLAHWVELPNPSSDAEYVYVSSSTDGAHWTPPVQAHRDHSPVQHGLVSMLGDTSGGASLFFLESLKGEDGPTFLMRSMVDASGKLVNEERLDADVCSCCPTAVAKTSKGLLVAYRDHTPKNIRDIAVVRLENGRWSASKIIYADNWEIDACPINAASVAAQADRVAVSWFTAAQDSPKVRMAFSSDSGASFSKPVTVSTGHAFGYTSVVLDGAGNAIVSWLERGAQDARVLVRGVTAAGVAGPVAEIAKGEKSGLGYPKLIQASNETFISWGSKVQTARLAVVSH